MSRVKKSTILLLLLLIFGCSSRQQIENAPNDSWSHIRSIAWAQVSKEEQKTVLGNWKQAEVKEVKWNDVPTKLTDKEPEKILKVTFKTKNDGMVGPIGIYIDPKTEQIVGYDARK